MCLYLHIVHRDMEECRLSEEALFPATWVPTHYKRLVLFAPIDGIQCTNSYQEAPLAIHSKKNQTQRGFGLQVGGWL